MRAPEELDTVDWSSLTHAYGGADEVPELIRGLYDPDPGVVDAALDELFGNVLHQGTVYPATAPAVPFLAHAALHAPAGREAILVLLAGMADQNATDAAIPVVAAVLQAVSTAAEELLPCLQDTDPAVRDAYISLAAVAEAPAPSTDSRPPPPRSAKPGLIARLTQVFARDPDPQVRGSALTALAGLDPDAGAQTAREKAAPSSKAVQVRLSAALTELERLQPPYPPELIEVLAVDGADREVHRRDRGSAKLGTLDERITKALTADPDAGFPVAARWATAGDSDGRAFWLADELGETWRDREAETLAVVTRSLSRQTDANLRRRHLSTIARIVHRVPEPDGTLDLLVRHARSTDDDVAAPALLALARFPGGDGLDGLLDRVREVLLAQQDLVTTALMKSVDPALLRPELTRLLAAGRSVPTVAGLLDAADPQVMALLRQEMRAGYNPLRHGMHGTNDTQRAAAAAALIRLGDDPQPSLAEFERLLTTGEKPSWYLPLAGGLGPVAAPLLPLIEPLLSSEDLWTRAEAAAAYGRISDGPDRAAPILTAVLLACGQEPDPVHLVALEALADLGIADAEIRPKLEHFVQSRRRLMRASLPSDFPDPDDRLRAAAQRLLTP